MKIWIDADACPKAIKEIVYRAAIRTQTQLILVANSALTVPPSPFISKIQVGSGFDVADARIVQEMEAGDLVITADIPLAAEVVDKGGIALNPRGELYTPANINERLAIRNVSTELRGGGLITGGPSSLGKHQIKAFANKLDAVLAQSK